jgi:predicted TIM-barrel fold metal-dependent hydrolase
LTAVSHASSADIRANLDHPIIDGDGHHLEFMPALFDYFHAEGGAALVDAYREREPRWYRMDEAMRRERLEPRPAWWIITAEKPIDYATVTFPSLLLERLPELGFDYLFMYPTTGMFYPHERRDEFRVPACRAYNRYTAELFRGFEEHMCPVGVIPMHTPDEAISELRYSVEELGLRAFMFPSYVRRFAGERRKVWLDTYGLDSQYDYDPVWAECIRLGVSPGFHSGGFGWPNRQSPTNWVFNHVGHFAAAGDVVAKSLFMGGVTRRFPQLRFAFLEGGVGWACMQLSSLIEHWGKRNSKVIDQYNPARVDLAYFAEAFDRYAPPHFAKFRDVVDSTHERLGIDWDNSGMLDEFSFTGIDSVEDFIPRFVEPFSFGCEADDAITGWAFQPKFSRLGVNLKAIFSSDIGHFDVPDIGEVLEEAYENVEKGLMDDDAFRDFTFTNIAKHYTSVNPGFFDGTAVEKAVRDLGLPG